MGKTGEISPSIYYVGVNDRTGHRFENLWPMPYGISYNSYLITGEKTALIDTVKIDYSERLIFNIKQIIGNKKIDYLIINHMEPDHSSSIPRIRKEYPDIKIIGNCRTIQMVNGFYGITDNVQHIKDNETLPLGNNTSLTFFLTPMIHWPETMMTYCHENKAIFTGDALGCFGALDGETGDENINTEKYKKEMYRYFSNIAGKYGNMVQKTLKKLHNTEIKCICPTHGPVWKKEIHNVIDIYDKASLYKAQKGVVLAYGSMYGNTEQAAEYLASKLKENGIKNIIIHNLAASELSFVLRDIFMYDTLIVGSPTYNNDLYPPVSYLIKAIKARGIKNRNFACFGSFTWGGMSVRKFNEFAKSMGWNIITTKPEFKQGFSSSVFEKFDEMAKEIALEYNK